MVPRFGKPVPVLSMVTNDVIEAEAAIAARYTEAAIAKQLANRLTIPQSALGGGGGGGGILGFFGWGCATGTLNLRH